MRRLLQRAERFRDVKHHCIPIKTQQSWYQTRSALAATGGRGATAAAEAPLAGGHYQSSPSSSSSPSHAAMALAALACRSSSPVARSRYAGSSNAAVRKPNPSFL